jgi:hypothetical protein
MPKFNVLVNYREEMLVGKWHTAGITVEADSEKDARRQLEIMGVRSEASPFSYPQADVRTDEIAEIKVDLGADFPRSAEEIERREKIANHLENALYCVRNNPDGGNTAYHIARAVEIMDEADV